MSARLLLVRPDCREYINTAVDPPLGLMSLCAMVKREIGDAVDVRLTDLRLRGASEKSFSHLLVNWRPDLVGFSILSPEARSAARWIRLTKDLLPEAKILIGGPYASAYRTDALEETTADVAFLGEAEHSLVAWLRCYLAGTPATNVPGLALHDEQGSAFITAPSEHVADLDSLPMPDWDAIDLDGYYRTGTSMNHSNAHPRYASLMGSRGCPYRCTYCHHINGTKVRFRNLEVMVEEISLLYHQFGVREIQLVDDIFNINKARVLEFCRLIRSSGMKLYFSFPNGLRADLLNEEIIDALYGIGAYSMTFAIESASPRIQKMIKKNLDLEKTARMIRYADSRGIFTRAFFMIGFVTETEEEVRQTIDFATRLPLLQACFFTVVPQKNTPLYDLTIKRFPSIGDEMVPQYYGMSPAYLPYDLAALQKEAYMRFYLASPRLWVGFWRIPDKVTFIKQIVSGGFQILLRRRHLNPTVLEKKTGVTSAGAQRESRTGAS
jgi:anaerobic magnesium-protoporphyrin IX monomethyl ester cyclase